MTIEECVYWLGLANHPLARDVLNVDRAKVWARIEITCARYARAEGGPGGEYGMRAHAFCAWVCRRLVHLLAEERAAA